MGRIKAVVLDWLPRRLDPLALYHWRTPRHNLLLMWLLGAVCLNPGRWLLAAAVLLTLTLLRRIAIQACTNQTARCAVRAFPLCRWWLACTVLLFGAAWARTLTMGMRTDQQSPCTVSANAFVHTQVRRGVLGFELQQLMTCESLQETGVMCSGAAVAAAAGDGHPATSATRAGGGAAAAIAQLRDPARYKDAADRLRARIAAHVVRTPPPACTPAPYLQLLHHPTPRVDCPFLYVLLHLSSPQSTPLALLHHDRPPPSPPSPLTPSLVHLRCLWAGCQATLVSQAWQVLPTF